MKTMIFTEGTILMHKNAQGRSRKEIIRQVHNQDKSIHDYKFYVPIGKAPKKILEWKKQGTEILYLTSRKKPKEVKDIQNVLDKYGFPKGKLLFRNKDEDYKDVVEKIKPEILIEDDCESIGGEKEMTITHIKPEIKARIKSIPIIELSGIDHLPDNLEELKSFSNS